MTQSRLIEVLTKCALAHRRAIVAHECEPVARVALLNGLQLERRLGEIDRLDDTSVETAFETLDTLATLVDMHLEEPDNWSILAELQRQVVAADDAVGAAFTALWA